MNHDLTALIEKLQQEEDNGELRQAVIAMLGKDLLVKYAKAFEELAK
ncbi:MAG: hypothetical protein IJW46_03650 [Clostridia bacterium]|nr:hypothetical protein [Clostridia bacterium]